MERERRFIRELRHRRAVYRAHQYHISHEQIADNLYAFPLRIVVFVDSHNSEGPTVEVGYTQPSPTLQ